MVKKAILFFTVLFMIFGCEPTVYEGAEKVENPTKSRSGYFNTDVTLGSDVVSVVDQFGGVVSGFVLSEEGRYKITYTDGKTEEIVIDKTPPVINGFTNTEQNLNLAKATEIVDNLGANAVSDNLSGWDYEMTATWKDGRDPFKEGPGDYVRVYVVYDRAGNASEPFEWEITAYRFEGGAGEEVSVTLKENGTALDGSGVVWKKELTSVTLTAEAAGGDGSYTYSWSVNDKLMEEETGNTLTLSNPEEMLYSVTVKVRDGGGMPAVKTAAVGFDKTPPVIQRGVKTLTGYTDDDLESLINAISGADDTEDDKVDETPAPPILTISKRGDLWTVGDHRIICGDSTDPATIDRLMRGEKAQVVNTDPPYGVSYQSSSGKFDAIENDDLTQDDLMNKLLIPALRNCSSKKRSVFGSGFPRSPILIWYILPTGVR